MVTSLTYTPDETQEGAVSVFLYIVVNPITGLMLNEVMHTASH